MATEYVPLPDVPHSAQTTTLGGSRFRLRFDFNARLCGWTCAIYTDGGDLITGGRRLIPGQDLLALAHRDPRAPVGVLMLVDETGAHEAPSADTIDRERWRLAWVPM